MADENQVVETLKEIRDDPKSDHIVVQSAIKMLSCYHAINMDVGDVLQIELMNRGVSEIDLWSES